VPTTVNPRSSFRATGLRHWMARVLDECDRVAADFSADPVHDLRVALRRCRSMADGLIAIDPSPDWKAMKKAGKRLFERLGDLRDTQIMMEWIEKLHPAEPGVARAPSPALSSPAEAQAPQGSEADEKPQDQVDRDPAAHALLALLAARESEQKREAHAALSEFDRKQWRHWSRSLPRRAARFRLGSPLFKHLALERWTAARELHARALRNRSQAALHALRIGLKRFRYVVENFLPAEHKAWSDDLKHLQDLLGEVHDLDVLWATAVSSRVFPHADSRRLWHARIVKERNKRVERYRQKMTGPGSLWQVWRAALPQGRQVQAIAASRMKLWARALDPDLAHSERVARFALQLYDGLTAGGLLQAANGDGARSSLAAAALLHDVGKSQGNKAHHKASLDLIRTHGTPLGWDAKDMQRAAIVARFHCGALPARSHKLLRDLLPDEQKLTIRLAAILRLANALDAGHDGSIRQIRIANRSEPKRRANGFLRKAGALRKNEAVIISADGYRPTGPTAQAIAAERHLLETVLRRPVIVRAMK